MYHIFTGKASRQFTDWCQCSVACYTMIVIPSATLRARPELAEWGKLWAEAKDPAIAGPFRCDADFSFSARMLHEAGPERSRMGSA